MSKNLEGAYGEVDECCDSIYANNVEGAVWKIEVKEVQCAMNHIKIGKTSGPSEVEVAIELFKVVRDKCLKSLTNIFNDILFKDKLLEEWTLSLIVTIFKGKGDPLNLNSYWGRKLLERVFKLYKKILAFV